MKKSEDKNQNSAWQYFKKTAPMRLLALVATAIILYFIWPK